MLLSGKEALDIENKNCYSEVNKLSYHYSLKTYIFLNISKLNLKRHLFFKCQYYNFTFIKIKEFKNINLPWFYCNILRQLHSESYLSFLIFWGHMILQ